jgi:hypothetical protein
VSWDELSGRSKLMDDHHPKIGQCIPEKQQQEDLGVERLIRNRKRAIVG